mmetsp:Transcript_14428/g.35282  ORF Transcript_14428/g.35282 Transcript_14428/m.35282 type:complete len:200 (-) Transcript_14428:46-645(-)
MHEFLVPVISDLPSGAKTQLHTGVLCESVAAHSQECCELWRLPAQILAVLSSAHVAIHSFDHAMHRTLRWCPSSTLAGTDICPGSVLTPERVDWAVCGRELGPACTCTGDGAPAPASPPCRSGSSGLPSAGGAAAAPSTSHPTASVAGVRRVVEGGRSPKEEGSVCSAGSEAWGASPSSAESPILRALMYPHWLAVYDF